MKSINRSLVLILVKEPYVQWANSTGDLKLSLEEHRKLAPAYLIPEIEDETDEEKVLRKHFSEIFKHELSAWCLDESTWPKIEFKTFKEWFDVQFHEIVFDCVESIIELQE